VFSLVLIPALMRLFHKRSSAGDDRWRVLWAGDGTATAASFGDGFFLRLLPTATSVFVAANPAAPNPCRNGSLPQFPRGPSAILLGSLLCVVTARSGHARKISPQGPPVSVAGRHRHRAVRWDRI